MAGAYLQGLQKSGKVLGTLKHFPGLGDVSVDPHFRPPDLLRPLSDLNAIDWAPYTNLIKQGSVYAVMVTHEYVKALYTKEPSSLSPKVIGILRKQMNTTVVMGEVTGVDKEQRCVIANSADREGVRLRYDYLVLATGASHSYFGHDEFERFAPGLKSLADAVAARNKILRAFEQADRSRATADQPRPDGGVHLQHLEPDRVVQRDELHRPGRRQPDLRVELR